MNRQLSPTDQGPHLDRPAAFLQTRQVAVAEAQGLDPPDHPEFPVILRDVAKAEILVADQQPVIRERGVAEAGQVGVGKGRTGRSLVRILRDRDGHTERVIIEVVVANEVDQGTGLRIDLAEERDNGENEGFAAMPCLVVDGGRRTHAYDARILFTIFAQW